MNRPETTVVLAMTADGKIADIQKNPARFASAADKAHLEKQISLADGVLFGAGTLRAYGTTLPITNLQLLEYRKIEKKSTQPVQILCSTSGEINSKLPFFQQPIPRWLLTTKQGTKLAQNLNFEKIIISENEKNQINWLDAFKQLKQLKIEKLAILGGSTLVASLLELDLIDQFWLTVCPLILGGVYAPTPVGGRGLSEAEAKRLKLLTIERVEDEIFLHYQLQR